MMPMKHEGLAKLCEEIGELQLELGQLQQTIGKKLARPDTNEHWDGKGDLAQRLQDEMADVQGAICFTANKLGLDIDAMNNRSVDKLNKFLKWDKEE